MTHSDDGKTLWRRMKQNLLAGAGQPASSPSRLAPHPERPASSPSRLGYRLAPQDEEAESERTHRPHPEVRPKGASKGEVRLMGASKGEAASEQPSKDEDFLALSAWLDGRLEAAEQETVEARLAADPNSLELALAAAEARGLAAPWPKQAQARAAQLVAPAVPRLRFAAVAASVLLVAVAGFELGRFGAETLPQAMEDPTDLAAELGLVSDFDPLEIVL